MVIILNFSYVALGASISIKQKKTQAYSYGNSHKYILDEIRYEYVCIFFTYCCIYDFVVRHTLCLDTMFCKYCIRNDLAARKSHLFLSVCVLALTARDSHVQCTTCGLVSHHQLKKKATKNVLITLAIIIWAPFESYMNHVQDLLIIGKIVISSIF